MGNFVLGDKYSWEMSNFFLGNRYACFGIWVILFWEMGTPGR